MSPPITTLNNQQLAALAAHLDRAKVHEREQGRSKVSDLEGWPVIAEANRTFDFDGGQRETVEVRCVAERERSIGSSGCSGWGVTYTVRVRVRVGSLIREGTGAGHGIDGDLGQAHESAIKEAETDAMKRALMAFGKPFGLALYDKQQREVSSAGATSAAPVLAPGRLTGSAPTTSNPSEQDPAFTPLDPATIRKLLCTLRALPRPALE